MLPIEAYLICNIISYTDVRLRQKGRFSVHTNKEGSHLQQIKILHINVKKK